MSKIFETAETFEIYGDAVDQEWIFKNRLRIEEETMDEMRRQGLIPVLDLSEGIKHEYNVETERFNYTLNIPGFRHPRAQDYLGIISAQALLINHDMTQVSVVEL